MKFFNKKLFSIEFWKKNKVVILATFVILISVLYWTVENMIDEFEIGRGDSSENDFEDVRDEEMDIKIDDNIMKSEETDDADRDAEAENTVEDSLNDIENKDVAEFNKIYVYVTGEVNNAGVVILNEGSRIVDAIDAAGGTTSKADISKVNLVYVLEDGMKVNIPNENDLKNNPDFEYITMNSGDGKNDASSVGKSSSISTSNDSSNNSASSHTLGIVNINTATQTELETLPGIGPSTALKIINYRKENGAFSSIDDIKKVSGIGDVRFENIKNYITV